MNRPDPLIQQLHDESEIRKLVVGFSLGMDLRDTTLFRQAWADEVELDLRTLAANTIPLTGRRNADDYSRDVITLLSGFTATQHVSTNHYIKVHGETAACTCYTHAEHYLRGDESDLWLTAGSRYELTAHRFPDLGWRFTSFALSPIFARGDRHIWQLVQAKTAGRSPANGQP